MMEFLQSASDVCVIPAEAARSENLSEILLPVFCSQANSGGGTVIIGAGASGSSLVIEGLPSIPETKLLVDELVSDRSKISTNTIKAVNIIQKNGKAFLKIEISPAPWTERPVYINSDPVHGVYWRSASEGGVTVLKKEFITMMAKDSVDIQRDNKRLEYFYESSVDLEALERYRKIHREKNPFLKWELLDDDSFMERIGAKSEGRLLRAGLLMFGENKNVSFCLREINRGVEKTSKAKNIWSFIESTLPIFDCDDSGRRQAISEAFFNSLIHADYSLGNVEVILEVIEEVITEDYRITFINSGIPRSNNNLSVCRNPRIMRMLCFVDYAKNKESGLLLIKNYSSNSKLSVDYDKWQTEIMIPATEQKKINENNVSPNLYPAAGSAKTVKTPEEPRPEDAAQIAADSYVQMVRKNSYASSAAIKDALFEYCNEFRTIGEMSAALLRPEFSVKKHINRMIKEGRLEKNENDAYRSVSGMKGSD